MRETHLKPPPSRPKAVIVAALWLLSILYTFTAHAEEACPGFRLDQAPALRAIPRWDQEDTFLCYAFSASVLIDAHRAPTEGFTSPLGLAADTVAFSQPKSQQSSFWGGRIEQSVAVARKGACRAGWVSDRLGESGLKELLPTLYAFQKEARAGSPAVVAEKLDRLLKEIGARNLPDTAFLVNILVKTQDEFISELLGFFCEERVAIELPPLHSEDRGFSDKVSFADRISDVLGSGVPVAAEFCAEVVTNPRFSPGYNSICSRHYAVVVGQRQEGRCELLIRDSQCGQYKGRAGNTGCEDSHYWIDRKAFLSNTQVVHWLR